MMTISVQQQSVYCWHL